MIKIQHAKYFDRYKLRLQPRVSRRKSWGNLHMVLLDSPRCWVLNSADSWNQPVQMWAQFCHLLAIRQGKKNCQSFLSHRVLTPPSSQGSKENGLRVNCGFRNRPPALIWHLPLLQTWQEQIILLLNGTADTGMGINNANLTLSLTGIIPPGLHTL